MVRQLVMSLCVFGGFGCGRLDGPHATGRERHASPLCMNVRVERSGDEVMLRVSAQNVSTDDLYIARRVSQYKPRELPLVYYDQNGGMIYFYGLVHMAGFDEGREMSVHFEILKPQMVRSWIISPGEPLSEIPAYDVIPGASEMESGEAKQVMIDRMAVAVCYFTKADLLAIRSASTNIEIAAAFSAFPEEVMLQECESVIIDRTVSEAFADAAIRKPMSHDFLPPSMPMWTLQRISIGETPVEKRRGVVRSLDVLRRPR